MNKISWSLIGMYVFAVLVNLALWAGVIYVVIHFIQKWW